MGRRLHIVRSLRECSTGPAPNKGPANLTLHVEEEGGRAAALRHRALALLCHLARFLAVLAAHRERQRAQPTLGNLLAALEAVAERTFLEPAERLLDLGQRLSLHLDEREFDVILDVRLGCLGSVEHAARRAVGPFAAHVTDLLVNLAHDLAAALFENPPQFRVAIAVHLSPGGLINAHMSPLLPSLLLPFVAGRYAIKLPV